MKPNLKLSENEMAILKLYQQQIARVEEQLAYHRGLLGAFVKGLLLARGLPLENCNINLQTGMIEWKEEQKPSS